MSIPIGFRDTDIMLEFNIFNSLQSCNLVVNNLSHFWSEHDIRLPPTAVSLAPHKDLNQEETACLSPSKGNKIYLPAPLKLNNLSCIHHYKNKIVKTTCTAGYVQTVSWPGLSDFLQSCHHNYTR